MPEDRLLAFMKEFLDSEHKAIRVVGIADMLREVVEENELPIEVLTYRNKILLRRTDASGSTSR